MTPREQWQKLAVEAGGELVDLAEQMERVSRELEQVSRLERLREKLSGGPLEHTCRRPASRAAFRRVLFAIRELETVLQRQDLTNAAQRQQQRNP